MRRIIPLFIPLVLFAQVQIDTVIHLPAYLLNGCFIPELNKLYIHTWNYHKLLVVECSTYQLKTEIPISDPNDYACFAWNWRRQKLYFAAPSPGGMLVIDPVSDTVVAHIPVIGSTVYAASVDRLYVGGGGLAVIDCATDSIVRWIPPPSSGYQFYRPSWDSVGNKIYVALTGWNLPPIVAVYDCVSDSLLAIIAINDAPGLMNFNYTYRKAYYAGGPAGVIDTKYDSLIRRFPIAAGGPDPVAVNTVDEKTYIAGYLGGPRADTLYVINCATDSIVKRVVYRGRPPEYVHWIPWSNRLYFGNCREQFAVVVDCNTDSVIVPELRLGRWAPIDIQLDPISERIFAIGAESTSVHVLRDVVSGVTETPASGYGPNRGARLRELRSGVELEYRLATAGWVVVSVFDVSGRRVKTLASGRYAAGLHRVLWNRADGRNARAARGAYFILLDTGQEQVRLKTVVR